MRATLLGVGLLLTMSLAPALGDEPEKTSLPKPARVAEEAKAASRAQEPVATTDRLRGLLGIVAILAVAFALSTDRRAISRRVLFWGLALQWAFALVVLRWGPGVEFLRRTGTVVEAVLGCALAGSEFVFGAKLVDPNGPSGFVFAFRVLPTVIFVAALFAVLYHLGVM